MSGHDNGHQYHHLPPNAELVEYVEEGDDVYGDVIPVDDSQLYYEEGDEIVDVEDVEIVEGELDGETIYEAPDGTRMVIQQRQHPHGAHVQHVQHAHHVQHQHHDQEILEPEDVAEPPQQHSRYRYHTAPQMPRPISGDEYSRSPRIASGPVYKQAVNHSQPTTSARAGGHQANTDHVYAIRNGQVYKIDKKTGRACAVRAQIKPSSSSIANQENQVTYASSPLTSHQTAPPQHSQPPMDYRKYGANPALTYFAHEQQRTFANAKNAKKAIGSKKPCNCSKSQCLKLYCECFASGEFCMDCNCKDCHNNMDYESERTRAVKATLERNPHAFRPKIGIGKKGPVDIERLHRRGCHCKKSNCLKNYCECYEAKVPCTDRCKCCGCRNTEAERAYRDNYRVKASPGLIGLAAAGSMEPRSTSPFSDDECEETPTPKKPMDAKALKGCPWFYLNDEVIEATATCLLEAVFKLDDPSELEKQQAILNEFSSCLSEVVESAMKNLKIDDEKFIDQVNSDRLKHFQPQLVKEESMEEEQLREQEPTTSGDPIVQEEPMMQQEPVGE